MKIFKTTALFMLIILLVNGCASRIPREALELTTTVGDDIKALHLSYRALIETHFNMLRLHTDSFIKNQWLPVFVNDFIKRGNLVQMVQNPQTGNMEQQVTDWVTVALETIRDKRNQLMKPIDEEEKKLLEMVDNSFSLLIRANSQISSHLKSLSKEKEQQERTFNIHGLKGLREKINKGLEAASRRITGSLDPGGKNKKNQEE